MPIQYLPISWPSYHAYALKLARSVLSSKKSIQHIVAISRGGLTLGHILSDLLRIPIATFAIQSYTDIKKQGESVVTEPLKTNIKGKHILLVDDVADSGKTLKRALSYLKRFHPASIMVVTMLYKPWSVFKPDYFVKTTTKWILFPYETTEMILLITKSLEKEGKTASETKSFLHALGYSSASIRYVRKYFIP